MRDRDDAVQRIAERVHRAPEIGQLEAKDDVGVRDQLSAAFALVERMARREVHAPMLIDDRRLQRFGQLNELGNARWRAREAVGDDHRVLCVDEQPRRFGHGSGIALRRRGHRQLRHAQAARPLSAGIGSSCSPPSITTTTGIIGGVIAIL